VVGADGISAVVLAGGESRRMGFDKRLIVVGSEPLLARVTRVLASLSDDVLIACRDRNQMQTVPTLALGLRVVSDGVPGGGPLAGVASALRSASHRHLLVVAVDMPFVSARLLSLIARRALGEDTAVVVRSPRGLEPLLAAYPAREARRAEDLLRGGERRMSSFVHAIEHVVVEPREWLTVDADGASFINWNSPGDVAPPFRPPFPAGRGAHD
jgi:molybdopterin-guanine dinucleotide biosynthesis protein A